MWLRQSRLAGSISGIVTTAVGLVVCAALLPGTTVDWRGLAIATAIMTLPTIGIDRYIVYFARRSERTRHLGRAAVGFLALTVWILIGPAVADWVTPHFNIGGVWQYVVVWLVMLGLALAYAKVIMTATSDHDLDEPG